MDCLEEHVLDQLVGGVAPPSLIAVVDEHLDRCVTCRRVVAGLLRGRDADGVGRHVGRYVLMRTLGVGASSIVYAAYDEQLHREVAIKIVHLGHTSGEAMGRFRLGTQNEAQALARLGHPNVVSVYEVGLHGDLPFIAMELVDGQNLNLWRRERPRAWTEVIDLMLGVGAGVAALHHAHLLHRDIKPDNILVGRDGRARLADFGLARVESNEALGTEPTGESDASSLRKVTLLGTPAYMAPEQLRGDEVGPRADIFSYCVTVYEALGGQRPFRGDSVEALLESISHGPPVLPDVPAWVNEALRRGLLVDPEDRYSDMGSLLIALSASPQDKRGSLVRSGTPLPSAWDTLDESQRELVTRGQSVTVVVDENSMMGETSYVWVRKRAKHVDPEACAAIYWDFHGHSTFLAAAGVRSYTEIAPFGLSTKIVRAEIAMPGLGSMFYVAEIAAYRTGPNSFSVRWHVPEFAAQPAPGLRYTQGSVDLERFPDDRGGALFIHRASAILEPAVSVDRAYKQATFNFHVLMTELLRTRFEQGASLGQLLDFKAAVPSW